MNILHYLNNERGRFGISPERLALSPADVLQEEQARRQEAIQQEQFQRQLALAQRRMEAQQRATEMQRAAQAQQYELQRSIAAARIGQQEEERALREKIFAAGTEKEKATAEARLKEFTIQQGEMRPTGTRVEYGGLEWAPRPKEPTEPTSRKEWELAGGEEGTGMSYADWVRRKETKEKTPAYELAESRLEQQKRKQANVESAADNWLSGYTSYREDGKQIAPPKTKEEAYSMLSVHYPSVNSDDPKWEELINKLPSEEEPTGKYGVRGWRRILPRVYAGPKPKGKYPPLKKKDTLGILD